MQYDSYHDKMKKVAAFLGKMYARRTLIIIALAVLTLVVTILVVNKGSIVLESDCPDRVVYGEKLGYRVLVVLGRTTYEYRAQGSTEWTTKKPVFPGDYQVRAMGKTASGEKKYTEIHDFTIVPREITLTVADRRIDYGDTPRIKADMAKGDKLSAVVRYGSMTPSTLVWVDERSVSITDKNGNDRMAGYVIVDTPKTELTIRPRALEVTVRDASKVYDDLALSFDGYEISGGSLVKGDDLVAVFDDSLTDAGTRDNTPRLRVYQSNGVEVTSLYDITLRSGTLTVEQRPLIIRTGSASYVYAGRALDHPRYTLDPTTPLVSGHDLAVESAATLLDCGTTDNVISFAVRNRAGGSETRNYAIFVEAGTLTVTPREVTIHTNSGTLIYDGTDQSLQEVTVENGVGDAVRAVQYSTIRNVGKAENRLTVAFVRDGKDISSNYIIKGYTYGTVTVEPRPITVQIRDVTKIFDGTPLKSAQAQVLTRPYGLAEGHSLAVKTAGSVIFGTTANRYVEGSAVILDENVQDVTDNYDITVLDGTLTVTPRPVTISTGNAYKVYDGTPLTQNTFSFDRNALLPGHALDFKVVGTRTEAGVSDNAVDRSSVSVRDTATGRDVSQYYDIQYDEGILEVAPRPLTIVTDPAEWMYDGTHHAGSTELHLTEGTLVAGHQMVIGSTVPVTIRDAGSIPNKIYADILSADGTAVLTHNYKITYDFGTLTVKKRPITVKLGDASWVYDGQSHAVTGCILDRSSPYSLASGHELLISAERAPVFSTVGSYANDHKNVTVRHARSREDVTANYTITFLPGTVTVEPRPLTLRIDGQKVYDGRPLDNWRVTYLDSTSLCRGHNLTAEPVRTVTDVGAITSAVDPDTLDITTAGGVSVLGNYDVTLEAGTLAVTSRHISVRSADAEKIYDGTPLTAPFGVVTEDHLPLAEGHRLLLTVTGTGTEIGQYPNNLDPDSLCILDGGGQDVTRNYTLDPLTEGMLTVKYDATVTVTTGSASKPYDGLPLVCGEYTVEVTEGALPEGFTVHVEVTGRITRVGQATNSVTVTVWDGEGNDVTACVTLDIRPGVLTVRRPEAVQPPVAEKPTLELIPAFRHKVWDGTYLYASNELVLTPSLAALLDAGYTYTVRIAGAQREIGDGESYVASFILYDPSGVDVTEDYELVKRNGLLRVTGRAVEVFLYPLEKVYDGRPAVWSEEDREILYLPEGLTLELSIRVAADVGLITLADFNEGQSRYVTYRVLQDGEDVTALYPLVFTLPEGMEDMPVLTVKLRDIELTAVSETRVDDGEPLTNAAVYISQGALAEGHTLEAFAEGTQTGVGTSENRVAAERAVIRDAEGRDVTDNYRVRTVSGWLTLVEPA